MSLFQICRHHNLEMSWAILSHRWIVCLPNLKKKKYFSKVLRIEKKIEQISPLIMTLSSGAFIFLAIFLAAAAVFLFSLWISCSWILSDLSDEQTNSEPTEIKKGEHEQTEKKNRWRKRELNLLGEYFFHCLESSFGSALVLWRFDLTWFHLSIHRIINFSVHRNSSLIFNIHPNSSHKDIWNKII